MSDTLHNLDGSTPAERQVLQRVADELGLAVTPVTPPARLRARVLDAVAPQPGILFNQAGLLIARSNDMPWQSTPVPGMSVKPLYVDAARQYSTMLLRMEPGTRFPSHRHAETEELFILQGDLIVEGKKMVTGDYCRGDANSIHGEVWTEAGGLYLVLSSQQNEMLG
ncbi:MAG: cupin domain-containing protein [Verrucomicrobiota bacterium]